MAKKSLKLHLGCGRVTPEGWVNIDGSWNARVAKIPLLRVGLGVLGWVPPELVRIPWSTKILVHDVRKRLPFRDQTVDAVYTSHLVDCLLLPETKRLLKECFRVLKPGGILRVVVEDVRVIVQEYLEGRSNPHLPESLTRIPAVDRMMARLLCQNPDPPPRNFLYQLYRRWTDFQSRKWAYDAESLIHHFEEVGFVEVSQRKCNESRLEAIEEIEKTPGICVEGIRP